MANRLATGQLEPINLKTGRLDFHCENPAMGYTMLQAFWNRQHYSGGAVYRPAFMRDMASNGPRFDTALLNTILFVASRYTPNQPDACASGMVFRNRTEESLHRFPMMSLTRSKLTTVQTLLLLADELFTWCDERSLSWLYLGAAINMIVDLGMHTVRSSFYQKGSTEDQEIARRVFWSAYGTCPRSIRLSCKNSANAQICSCRQNTINISRSSATPARC